MAVGTGSLRSQQLLMVAVAVAVVEVCCSQGITTQQTLAEVGQEESMKSDVELGAPSSVHGAVQERDVGTEKSKRTPEVGEDLVEEQDAEELQPERFSTRQLLKLRNSAARDSVTTNAAGRREASNGIIGDFRFLLNLTKSRQSGAKSSDSFAKTQSKETVERFGGLRTSADELRDIDTTQLKLAEVILTDARCRQPLQDEQRNQMKCTSILTHCQAVQQALRAEIQKEEELTRLMIQKLEEVNNRLQGITYAEQRRPQAECPENWLKLDGSCYGLLRRSETWYSALVACASQNRQRRSRLATVYNPSEALQLLAAMRHVGIHDAWIGAVKGHEATWRWIDTAVPIDVRRMFITGRPQGDANVCGVFHQDPRDVRFNGIEDIQCTSEAPAILCQMDLD